MLLKIKKEIEEEIEIEFPLYYKYAGYVKVVSPDTWIRTRVEGGEFSVEKTKGIPTTVSNVILKGKPCTEEEFKAAYQTALNHIMHEAFMQASEKEKIEVSERILFGASEAAEFEL